MNKEIVTALANFLTEYEEKVFLDIYLEISKLKNTPPHMRLLENTIGDDNIFYLIYEYFDEQAYDDAYHTFNSWNEEVESEFGVNAYEYYFNVINDEEKQEEFYEYKDGSNEYFLDKLSFNFFHHIQNTRFVYLDDKHVINNPQKEVW